MSQEGNYINKDHPSFGFRQSKKGYKYPHDFYISLRHEDKFSINITANHAQGLQQLCVDMTRSELQEFATNLQNYLDGKLEWEGYHEGWKLEGNELDENDPKDAS